MEALQKSNGDPVLQFINNNYVTLQEGDRKSYMVHFHRVLNELVTMMKKDPLFEALFSRLYWAGSYYDGLRVGKPDEYDVDMVIKLPIDYSTIELVTRNVHPQFVKLRALSLVADTFRKSPNSKWKEIYKPLDGWTDADGFLLQNKLRSWFESVVSRTLGNAASLELDIDGHHYKLTKKKTGPAMTFLITVDRIKIDFDLVPVLEFRSDVKWPPAPFRDGPLGQSWFAVPKPNSQSPDDFKPTFWRLGFHDQEQQLINGKELLKPVCKLLKKLRDNDPLFTNLASYYIKTMFLWEEHEPEDPNQWRSGITDLFLKMLSRLEENLRAGHIDYFWNKQYNLIDGMSTVTKTDLANRVAYILKKITREFPDDPTILATFLLTSEELNDFRKKYNQSSDVNDSDESHNQDDDELAEKPRKSCCIL